MMNAPHRGIQDAEEHPDFAPIAIAMDELARDFLCQDGPAQACGPTGEPYLSLSLFASTPAELAKGWLENVRRLAPSGATRLYWRTRPELDVEDDGFRLYSRFLITEKEPSALDAEPAGSA